ncbi:MAG: recombinase RecT, partial [Chloroflexota bacterium]|nr:recombinase RecT [Chloroflexota bacterium]
EWTLMLDMASALVPTGFLPESIKNPQQAVAIMLKGRELGVPTMYALSNIVIVKGKPTISAEMMLALIYRDHGKRAIRVKVSDDRQCTIEYRLDGWADVSSYVFSMEQAQHAGLTTNPTWTKYPAAMLRARCISAVARMAYPESIAGMYVPGELGEAVTVTDEGEVLSVAETGVIEAQAFEPGQAPATIRRAPQDAPEPPIDRGKVMQRLHSYVPHDALHGWAVEKKYESVADMPIEALIDLGKSFKAGGATAFMAQHAPAAGQSSIDGLDDLHAQLDRDRAAERARA